MANHNLPFPILLCVYSPLANQFSLSLCLLIPAITGFSSLPACRIIKTRITFFQELPHPLANTKPASHAPAFSFFSPVKPSRWHAVFFSPSPPSFGHMTMNCCDLIYPVSGVLCSTIPVILGRNFSLTRRVKMR